MYIYFKGIFWHTDQKHQEGLDFRGISINSVGIAFVFFQSVKLAKIISCDVSCCSRKKKYWEEIFLNKIM